VYVLVTVITKLDKALLLFSRLRFTLRALLSQKLIKCTNELFIRHFHKIAKTDYYLHHVCPSVNMEQLGSH
jgi:hypothetical protein